MPSISELNKATNFALILLAAAPDTCCEMMPLASDWKGLSMSRSPASVKGVQRFAEMMGSSWGAWDRIWAIALSRTLFAVVVVVAAGDVDPVALALVEGSALMAGVVSGSGCTSSPSVPSSFFLSKCTFVTCVFTALEAGSSLIIPATARVFAAVLRAAWWFLVAAVVVVDLPGFAILLDLKDARRFGCFWALESEDVLDALVEALRRPLRRRVTGAIMRVLG